MYFVAFNMRRERASSKKGNRGLDFKMALLTK